MAKSSKPSKKRAKTKESAELTFKHRREALRYTLADWLCVAPELQAKLIAYDPGDSLPQLEPAEKSFALDLAENELGIGARYATDSLSRFGPMIRLIAPAARWRRTAGGIEPTNREAQVIEIFEQAERMLYQLSDLLSGERLETAEEYQARMIFSDVEELLVEPCSKPFKLNDFQPRFRG